MRAKIGREKIKDNSQNKHTHTFADTAKGGQVDYTKGIKLHPIVDTSWVYRSFPAQLLGGLKYNPSERFTGEESRRARFSSGQRKPPSPDFGQNPACPQRR